MDFSTDVKSLLIASIFEVLCCGWRGSNVLRFMTCCDLSSGSSPWLGLTNIIELAQAGVIIFLGGWFHVIGLEVLDLSVGNSTSWA